MVSLRFPLILVGHKYMNGVFRVVGLECGNILTFPAYLYTERTPATVLSTLSHTVFLYLVGPATNLHRLLPDLACAVYLINAQITK